MLELYDKENPPEDGTIAMCRFVHPAEPFTEQGGFNHVVGMCKYSTFSKSWETPFKTGLVSVQVDYFVNQDVVLNPPEHD